MDREASMPKNRLVLKLSVLPLVLLGCCTWMNKVLASAYLPPRLSVDANAGGSATVGQADLLLSLKGDERRNLYLDPQAAYGTDEQWYADLGLGYRWIQNDAAILGGYVFASRSQVGRQCGFWIANPGVEALGSRWDARINGYIPIGGRNDEIGVFPFIQSSQLVFSGHTESLLTTYVNGNETQQIGDGVDAKVGYQVFRNVPLKAYLGVYFFAIPHTNNVRGGAAGVEYWFDQHVKAFVNYTYDNLQYNTVVGGLAVSFGGVDESRADPSLSERLTDPVERYLANLGHGSGIPSETMLTNMQTGVEGVLNAASINNMLNGPSGGSNSQILSTKMAFFSQTGTPNNGGVGLTMANCTFANPCGPSDFSQTGVNGLNVLLPGTVMFFNGGTYPAANGSSALTLNNGQDVFGRSANYTAAAVGTAQPTFNGAFILNGNNTIDSVILNNSLGVNTTAITSNGGQNLVMSNLTIGSAANPYPAAMNLINVTAALTNSSVFVAANPSSSNVLIGGITLTGSSLVMQLSKLSVYGTPNLPTAILLHDRSSLTLNDSQLNTFSDIDLGLSAIDLVNNSMAVINNSTLTVRGAGGISTVYGLGIYGEASMIAMNGGSLSVSTNSLSSGASLTNGGPSVRDPTIVFNGVTCTLNGNSTRC